MSRILELAQQGKTYLYQAILGFFKPFAGYCLRKRLFFSLPGVFSLCLFGFFFFPNSPFFPLPLPVLPVSTSLALPGAASFPQAALTTSCSSAGRAVLLVHRGPSSAAELWEEETKAGKGIRVSAEHCLSQASFLYSFILTLLYLTALSLEIRSMLALHAVPSWCTLHVSTSAVLDVFSLGDPLLFASASGSGSGQEIGDQEPGPFCATRRRRRSLPSRAGAASRQDEEEEESSE